jgi:2'-5' RNA ligase
MSQRPQAELAPAPRSRLFFALWPDATQRGELYRLARCLHSGCGGRVTRRDKLHLTLVFLGNVERERISQLVSLAKQPRIPRFELEFGVMGYWRHNRIVWAAPVAIPPALSELVAALEDILQTAGFRFDRRPYAPHVTLIRDARAPNQLPRMNSRWEISQFSLVQAVRDELGSRYEIVANWPLAAGVP